MSANTNSCWRLSRLGIQVENVDPAAFLEEGLTGLPDVDLLLAGWPNATFDLLLDSGYANRTVLRGLPPRVRVFAAIDLRAALTDPAGRPLKTGRHSPKGAPLPRLPAWAADALVPWTHGTADVYGGARAVHFKTRAAQWWHVLGAAPVRVVVLQCTTGTIALRAFLCTDPTVDAPAVLVAYARRRSSSRTRAGGPSSCFSSRESNTSGCAPRGPGPNSPCGA
jgi:hypothetical protein